MTLQDIQEIIKGGRGSGDFGHTGRAGKHGGSGGGGGKGKPRRGRRSRAALDKEIANRKKPKRVKESGVFIKGDPVDFVLASGEQGTGTVTGHHEKWKDIVNIMSSAGEAISLSTDSTRSSISHVGELPKPKKVDEPKKPKIKVEPGMELPDGMVLRKEAPEAKRGRGVHFFITKDGLIMDLTRATGNSNTHPGAVAFNMDNENFSAAMGLSGDDKKNIGNALNSGDSDAILKPVFAKGAIRVRQSEDGSVIIQTDKVDKRALRKLQKLYDKRKLNLKINTENFWENNDLNSSASFSFEDFLSAKFVTGSGQNISLKELEPNYDFEHLIDVLT